MKSNPGTKKGILKEYKFLSILGVFFILVLSVSTLHFEVKKRSYKKELALIKEAYNSTLKQRDDSIKTTRGNRVKYYKKKLLSHLPVFYSYRIADFLRKLSLYHPTEKGIRILSIEANPINQDIDFKILASIKTAQKKYALMGIRDLKYFLENMKSVIQVLESDPQDSNRGDFQFTLKGSMEVQ